MTASGTQKCALNLITGQLGAGKTTFLRQLLKHKPTQEHWVILVNEFGAVGVDGAILKEQSHTQVQQIPGGCICCTAKDELKETVLKLLNSQTPDRILIEPTGLGEPQSLVDLFHSAELTDRLEIQTLFSVFDMALTDVMEVKKLAILQSLITMADVILLNKIDLASPQKTQDFQDYLAGLFPPKLAVIATQQAKIDYRHLNYPHFPSPKFIQQNQPFKLVMPNPSSSSQQTETSISLIGCHTRQRHQDLNTQSIGWIFDPQIQFDWKKLQNIFNHLTEMPNTLLRAKGVFRVGDQPRMLFQLVHQTVSRELIAYRKDSRLEVLLTANHPFDLASFERQLADSIATERTR